MELFDKPISEMTDEQIIEEINALRERRQQARARAAAPKTGVVTKPRRPSNEVTGEAADILGDILGLPKIEE